MQKFSSETGMHYLPPTPLVKRRFKIIKVKDQTAPHPKFDSDVEYKFRDQKPPSATQATSPLAATRGKYTKKLKELIQQHRCGHYTQNKYDLLEDTHLNNTRERVYQVMRVEPTVQYISVLEKICRYDTSQM